MKLDLLDLMSTRGGASVSLIRWRVHGMSCWCKSSIGCVVAWVWEEMVV